ncbi:MAG: hypothetical protein K0M70_09000 [Arenimonas sp.]|uniref:hypothetical protein n=1 Tax=Arenimonas sp. TaxID=1872635 RepID=UPI0025BE4432|nr:hypothetical protein [Arenimonas sp.]MBW8367981.1 hypothetical protein [Arenimonas sp.]
MRPVACLLLLTGLSTLAACSRGLDVEIPNNDSAALVEAIRLANASPGHDTVRLARNGLYILTKEVQAGLLLPVLGGELTIEGNYAEIRGYAAGPAALVEVSQDAQVVMRNLLLAEGTEGALRNYGDLRLERVAIVDSSVDHMPAIVLNHGHLEAKDSQIAFNLLLATRRDSGTVLNYGEILLENSRIHDNRALGRQPSVAVSGGILNFGSVKVDGLVLDNNTMDAEDGPLLSFGGILNLGNGRVKEGLNNSPRCGRQ